MKKIHGAIIQLDTKFLLEKVLDFKGAILHDIYLDRELFSPSVIQIKLEHPDLPEVEEHMPLSKIYLIFEATYGKNGVITSIKRIDPPRN